MRAVRSDPGGLTCTCDYDTCSGKWYITATGCFFISGVFGSFSYEALIDRDPADCMPPAGLVPLTLVSCFGPGCVGTISLYIDKP
jgi:hypothetical protein